MSSHLYDSQKYFFAAVGLSAALHGLVFGTAFWLPSAPQIAVLEAPNAPEIHVLREPVVTVMEGEIITKAIMHEDAPDALVVHDRQPTDQPAQPMKPAIASQRSSGAVTAAKPLMHVNPAPAYPMLARERGWEGTVRLNVHVEPDGHPSEVSIEHSSGHAALDDSALKTVRYWKFSPASAGAMKFSSKIIIPIQFTLLKE